MISKHHFKNMCVCLYIFKKHIIITRAEESTFVMIKNKKTRLSTTNSNTIYGVIQ